MARRGSSGPRRGSGCHRHPPHASNQTERATPWVALHPSSMGSPVLGRRRALGTRGPRTWLLGRGLIIAEDREEAPTTVARAAGRGTAIEAVPGDGHLGAHIRTRKKV